MNIRDILHTAISIEKEGINFYTKSAKRIKDENGRGTLVFLANEEKRHKAFFESALKKHGKGDKTSVKLLMTPRLFPKAKDYKGKSASEIDLLILEHARDTEKHSVEFYTVAKSFADEKLREGLDIVIKEEEQHLSWVEYLLENIRSNDSWGSLHRHFSLDGG